MTENRVFLLSMLAFAAITVVVALLVGPGWMDWGGWRWLSLVWALWVGGWVGWSLKATNERARRWREELERSRDPPDAC